MPATATKLAPAIVTAAELTELAAAEEKYAKAKKTLAAAEGDVKLRRMQLAEKVLGVKTEEEFKALDLAAVEKKIAKRLEAGDWKLGPKAPEFSFVNTSKGRYPAWQKLFAAELGESAAAKITNDMDYQYSYRVDVQVA
jgi:hypothetical protein